VWRIEEGGSRLQLSHLTGWEEIHPSFVREPGHWNYISEFGIGSELTSILGLRGMRELLSHSSRTL
jgi:hypothetical protein